jgi:hypothetical protein
MRRQLRSLRGRSMARRPGEDGPTLAISPRAARIGGWVLAALIIIGIAVAVSVLGGDGDEVGSRDPSVPPSSSAEVAAIAFGTEFDATTGEVAEGARLDRFAAGDTFAYSARPSAAPPQAIYVEVRRVGGGATEVVQEPSEQLLPEGAQIIAFSVAADRLLTDFGPGDYVMTIYPTVGDAPIAEGPFTLVGPATSASPAP